MVLRKTMTMMLCTALMLSFFGGCADNIVTSPAAGKSVFGYISDYSELAGAIEAGLNNVQSIGPASKRVVTADSLPFDSGVSHDSFVPSKHPEQAIKGGMVLSDGNYLCFTGDGVDYILY